MNFTNVRTSNEEFFKKHFTDEDLWMYYWFLVHAIISFQIDVGRHVDDIFSLHVDQQHGNNGHDGADC